MSNDKKPFHLYALPLPGFSSEPPRTFYCMVRCLEHSADIWRRNAGVQFYVADGEEVIQSGELRELVNWLMVARGTPERMIEPLAASWAGAAEAPLGPVDFYAPVCHANELAGRNENRGEPLNCQPNEVFGKAFWQ